MEYQPKFNKCILAISFANYLKEKTGIPKVMMEHAKMYENNSVSYVSLFTVKKNICHDKYMLFCMYGLTVDGEYRGIYQIEQIIDMLIGWHDSGINIIDIHVHHLLYNRIENINRLLCTFPDTPIKFFLHDYYIMCSNYTLVKNGEHFCGGKGFNSTACKDCISKKSNERVNPDIQKLLSGHIERITFVSPSESTRKIFCNFYSAYSDKAVVIPHQKYSKFYRGNLEPLGNNEKIKVGYLGMPHKHKGWETWLRIIEQADPNSYEFYVFNSSDEEYEAAKKVFVQFSKDNLNVMTDALRSNKIDVVVMWANWPETYSYTCFEAYAANAFILTHKDSGNVADVVNANRCGKVYSSEESLLKLFSSPKEFRSMINEYKKTTLGGPDDLTENDEIVNISLRDAQSISSINYKRSTRPINRPLLRFLRWLYK